MLAVSDSQPLPDAAISDETPSLNEAVKSGPLAIFSLIPSMHDCDFSPPPNRVAESFSPGLQPE